MKNIIGIISVCLLISSYANGQTTPQKNTDTKNPKDDIYCVALRKDYMLVVVNQDKELQADKVLSNGSIIKIDGTVLNKDNSLLLLNFGECVDHTGKQIKVDRFRALRESYSLL